MTVTTSVQDSARSLNEAKMISQEQVQQVLRQVIDPELGLNIVDLGLIYSLEVRGNQIELAMTMTMTTPACPLSGYLLEMVEAAIWQQIVEVESVNLKLVWEPPWHPGLMSDEGKAALGWIG